MASASMNRVGSNALLVGGILWVIAILLHPNVSTLELAASANVPLWIAVHWAYLVGDALLIAGLFMLLRHIAARGSETNEAWARMAVAAGTMAFTLDAAATGIHLFAFPPVLSSAGASSVQNVFETAGAVNTGIGSAGFMMASLTLVVLGTVLSRDGWPAALAYGAIAIGILEFMLGFVASATGRAVIPVGVAALAVNALMPACYAATGAVLGRRTASGTGGR